MLSDVGISMGINGSGASKEVSDIVLVDDDPSKVSSAIKISKYTRKIVWENIILSAVVKITFLLLGTFGVTGMLFAVFADVGVTVLAILNSMRALKYKPNKKVKKYKEKNKTCRCMFYFIFSIHFEMTCCGVKRFLPSNSKFSPSLIMQSLHVFSKSLNV